MKAAARAAARRSCGGTEERRGYVDSLAYYAQMVAIWQWMAPDEKASLEAWDRDEVDGNTVKTSDWPGWRPYLGDPPWANLPEPKQRPTRKAISRREMLRVFKRDGFRCRHCDTDDTDELTVDHIIPLARGGTETFDNYQTLCRRCNSRKGTR